jgi:hypothetical protein
LVLFFAGFFAFPFDFPFDLAMMFATPFPLAVHARTIPFARRIIGNGRQKVKRKSVVSSEEFPGLLLFITEGRNL